MAVEDAGPAKAEEQDHLKALDASIANLERARGGKPDVAIDEVLRQKRLERQELKDQMQFRKSTKALLKSVIAAREKAVIKLEGLQKEEMDLTQLLLLKQQEISDAKSDAADKAREVETLQARRLAEVDCEGSVSHVSSSASCSAPLSPQQCSLGLAASLPEDVRVKFEEWYSSVEIEACYPGAFPYCHRYTAGCWAGIGEDCRPRTTWRPLTLAGSPALPPLRLTGGFCHAD